MNPVPWNEIETNPELHYDTTKFKLPTRLLRPENLSNSRVVLLCEYFAECDPEDPFVFVVTAAGAASQESDKEDQPEQQDDNGSGAEDEEQHSNALEKGEAEVGDSGRIDKAQTPPPPPQIELNANPDKDESSDATPPPQIELNVNQDEEETPQIELNANKSDEDTTSDAIDFGKEASVRGRGGRGRGRGRGRGGQGKRLSRGGAVGIAAGEHNADSGVVETNDRWSAIVGRRAAKPVTAGAPVSGSPGADISAGEHNADAGGAATNGRWTAIMGRRAAKSAAAGVIAVPGASGTVAPRRSTRTRQDAELEEEEPEVQPPKKKTKRNQ